MEFFDDLISLPIFSIFIRINYIKQVKINIQSHVQFIIDLTTNNFHPFYVINANK